MFKRFFPLLFLIFLLWCESVNAYTISDLQPVGSHDLGGSFEANFNGNTSYTEDFTFINSYTNTNGYQFLVFPYSLATESYYQDSGVGGASSFFINSFVATITFDGPYYNLCQIETGYIICPINKDSNYTKLSLTLLKTPLGSKYIEFYINSRYAFLYNSIQSQQNQTIIQNQQDIINNQNETNDILNNDNTSSSTTSGGNWFSGFRVDNTKGFTSIITAPIRLVQGILNGSSSCTNLTIPISLKHNSTTLSNEVSLPCGSILWNNVPNTAVLLYWSTIFGLFAWWVLRDMYKFIDSIRDPDDKTEFLMKL